MVAARGDRERARWAAILREDPERARTLPSDALLDLLFDAPGVGRCLVGPDGSVLRANADWLAYTGFTEHDVLGANLVALFPDTRDLSLALHARARAGHHVEVPPHAQLIEGRETWWKGSIDPVPMAGGVGLLITAVPVRTEVGSGSLLDVVNDAVFVHDAATGAVLDVNRKAEELYDASREEIRAGGIEAFSCGEAPYTGVEALALLKAAAGGAPQLFEWRARTRSGRVFWVEVNLKSVAAGGSDRVFAVVRDITDRKRAEEALRESEAKLRLLAEAMPQIVCVLSPEGAVEYVNPTWEAFSGLDLAATRAAGWPGVLHPDDLEAARACRVRLLKQQAPQEIELRYRAADGGYRWFLSRLAPVVQDGRVVRFVGAAMDIEDRKRAEVALREADRHKDQFLGMLSHELRNPLAPIRNSVWLLRHGPEAQRDRALRIVERQTHHLTRMVDDLLDLTRIARGKTQLRPEPLDLRDVVRRTGEDFRSVVEERDLVFRVVLPGERVSVRADATRVGQVIGNLLANAAKFTRPGDEVTLSLATTGQTAELRVVDSGAGIEPALLPRIFEPFVQGDRTLARTEGGLGLGLALVKGLVELQGGTISAHSEGRGKGATFTVRLPTVTVRDSLAGP